MCQIPLSASWAPSGSGLVTGICTASGPGTQDLAHDHWGTQNFAQVQTCSPPRCAGYHTCPGLPSGHPLPTCTEAHFLPQASTLLGCLLCTRYSSKCVTSSQPPTGGLQMRPKEVRSVVQSHPATGGQAGSKPRCFGFTASQLPRALSCSQLCPYSLACSRCYVD